MLLNAISVIIGLIGTIALSETMSFDLERTAYGNSMSAFLFVLFTIIILRYVYSHTCFTDKRGKLFATVYSAGLSFALVAGKQLHTVENFTVGDVKSWIQILILAIFFFGPVLYVLQWIAKKADEGAWNFRNKSCVVEETERESNADDCKEARKKSLNSFLLTWLIIFLCWIPVFLAFYPGAFVYDAQDEYVQVATRTFTTHHPLAHVLLLGGSVCFGNKFLGSYNAGIALYTIFQMVVLSGVFAYTITWLRKYFSKGMCVGITLFYGVFPVFPMYAVCSAKDTLFNAAFLVMLVQMVKLLENAYAQNRGSKIIVTCEEKAEGRTKYNRRDVLLFVLSAAAMMLFRNNGKMAYLVLLAGVIIWAVIHWKKERFWIRFAVMMLVAFVLYTGVDKALVFVTHAEKGGKQEILTVPIQQVTRTYKYSPEAFSQEDKELLISYIPEDVLAIYDADLSDLVKVHFDNEKFAENPSEFLGLWLRTFVKKPVTYLNAWFMTSYGYWYPDTVINVYGGQERFTFQYEESSYFGFETELPGERDSQFPWLEEQYRKMSLELYQQNVPGISMLFSPGFLFWVFIGCVLMSIYRKRYGWLIPMISVFLLWGTVILGPTFLVRYVLILWFALPVFVVPVLTQKK